MKEVLLHSVVFQYSFELTTYFPQKVSIAYIFNTKIKLLDKIYLNKEKTVLLFATFHQHLF